MYPAERPHRREAEWYRVSQALVSVNEMRAVLFEWDADERGETLNASYSFAEG